MKNIASVCLVVLFGCSEVQWICSATESQSTCWSFDEPSTKKLLREECDAYGGSVAYSNDEDQPTECPTEGMVGSCAEGGDLPRTTYYYSTGDSPFDAESAEADCGERGGSFTSEPEAG